MTTVIIFFLFLGGARGVNPSMSCSAWRAIFALAGLARAIFCHRDGRALDLSQYLPNRLKSLPVPARGPACCLGSRGGEGGERQKEGWPAPKTPNLPQTCPLRAGTCERVFVCDGDREGVKSRRREGDSAVSHKNTCAHT